MEVKTKLNTGQRVFLLRYNSILDCHVKDITVYEELTTTIGNEEKKRKQEHLFTDREECRKAVMLKVMDM